MGAMIFRIVARGNEVLQYIATPWKGPLHRLIQMIAPAMIARRDGAIVIVSSMVDRCARRFRSVTENRGGLKYIFEKAARQAIMAHVLRAREVCCFAQ
jgi:hypothetical protein